MSVFRDYTSFYGAGISAISSAGATVRFGVFNGSIDGVNQTFAAPEILGTSKDTFRVFYNGVLVDTVGYNFTAPNVIALIAIVPAPPDRPLEYCVFGS